LSGDASGVSIDVFHPTFSSGVSSGVASGVLSGVLSGFFRLSTCRDPNA
jgi:hypothetical protein